MNFIKKSIIGVRFDALFLCVFFIFFIFGCYPAPKVPLDTLQYQSPAAGHRHLFVFLPGNGDKPDTFDKKGLVRAVREHQLPVDMIAVNAHIGYYMSGSIFTRLKEDVIDPAKARGYKKIWLIGNSLGGYGSVSYARQYPQDITGIVLLGPFLGDKKIIEEIRDAGGLQKWEPTDITVDGKERWEKELWKWLKNGDEQKGFWHWIKNCDEDGECPSRIYLGFGKRDRFSPGQRLLAERLPPENVFAIDGGHDWRTWKKLWGMILDRMSPGKPAVQAEAAQELH
jgi:pimeloyl-ACP methyl ester carboxylesterase